MLLLHFLNDHIAQLRAETEVVNRVREGVRVLVLEKVLQIVYMQVAVGERFSGGNVEVSNDFVYANAAIETASFLALLVEMLSVVFAFALLDTLAATERP